MTLLISESYRRLNAELHQNPDFGRGYHDRPNALRKLTAMMDTRDVLDYGCGKGMLKRACEPFIHVREYDPAIPGKDGMPEPADIVACFDVLEHVEPECLDAVLDHIQSLARKAAIFVVHTGAAMKTLADGRNAHLTQEPPSWWLPKLDARWRRLGFNEGKNGLSYVGVTIA